MASVPTLLEFFQLFFSVLEVSLVDLFAVCFGVEIFEFTVQGVSGTPVVFLTCFSQKKHNLVERSLPES